MSIMLKAFDLLFPAHAGVILLFPLPFPSSFSFPRTCGGDPGYYTSEWMQKLFSPHTRGCPRAWAERWGSTALFPAYAGVILVQQPLRCCHPPFPRIRGGDPRSYTSAAALPIFSPAYAGVIPPGTLANPPNGAFPRTCGGDPTRTGVASGTALFSPHMRGVIPG